MLIEDPSLYLVAIPALLITGISKGGYAGGLGVLAVPLLSVVIDPLQAAAILLPVLCLMDLVAVWTYRWKWDGRVLRVALPAATFGIALGTALYSFVAVAGTRLMVGVIAVSISLSHWWKRREGAERFPGSRSLLRGGFWSAVAGFASLVSHGGGPAANAYLLSLRLHKTVHQATAVAFFTTVNYVKLIPYAWLGRLDAANLGASLTLLPVALVGVGAGIWLHDRVSSETFHRVVYLLLFVSGAKLLYDGFSGVADLF